MSFTPIVEEATIDRIWREFEQKLETGRRFDRGLNFIGGDPGSALYWHAEHGFWASPDTYDDRFLCACGRDDPQRTSGALSIVVALNPPHAGWDRRISTLLATNRDGDVWLLHTGKFPRVRKALAERHFESWSTVVWPDGKSSSALEVAPMTGPNTLRDVGRFVHAVAAFKASLVAARG